MKPTNINKIIGIVDGDVLIYRACGKATKENLDVKTTFDEIYNEIKRDTGCDEYSLHISGHGNFRKEIKQPYTEYKGKRKDKPENFRECKDYVITTYKPTTVDKLEADDTASIEATKYLKENQLFMLITLDKDWKTISGLYYNVLYNNLIAVSKTEAAAFFHEQLLTGDSVDNIPGIYGVGPIKAKKLLENKTLIEQFACVIKAYKEHYKKDYKNRLEVMGKMLYLLKSQNDNWTIDFWKGHLKNV